MTTEPVWALHLLLCNNQREEGELRPSCGRTVEVMPLIKHLKKRIKQEGRNLDIRAQKAGCFDLCELGPVMVAYPEGHYYRVTDLETLDIVYESLTAQRPRIDANVYRIEPLQVPHVRARLKRQ